jgi:hypothetical protein
MSGFYKRPLLFGGIANAIDAAGRFNQTKRV